MNGPALCIESRLSKIYCQDKFLELASQTSPSLGVSTEPDQHYQLQSGERNQDKVRDLSLTKQSKSASNTIMARGLNLKPSRVYQTATLLMESQGIAQPPCWYKTIESIPPAAILTRTQPAQHRELRKSKVRKPSKMFHPQPIEYEEDKLRREFFSDHPWELARPRIVLEDDGKDGQKCDWSRILQRGRPLTGERYGQPTIVR